MYADIQETKRNYFRHSREPLKRNEDLGSHIQLYMFMEIPYFSHNEDWISPHVRTSTIKTFSIETPASLSLLCSHEKQIGILQFCVCRIDCG